MLMSLSREMSKETFDEYQISVFNSKKVASNRTLPDVRDPNCWDIKYPQLLPSASIVMVVHNEAWTVLKRAIQSVLNRSPEDLLEEFIIVDDFSDKKHMKRKLERYLKKVSSKIKLIRSTKREGVIRSRIIGADAAIVSYQETIIHRQIFILFLFLK